MSLHATIRNPNFDASDADETELLLTLTHENGGLILMDEPTGLISGTATLTQLETLRAFTAIRFGMEVVTSLWKKSHRNSTGTRKYWCVPSVPPTPYSVLVWSQT
jgi:hypothetical protein